MPGKNLILQISKTVRAIISRKKLAILILSAVMTISANVLAQPGNGRVATLDFQAEGINESEAAAVSGRLRSGFVNHGAFAVLHQGEINSVSSNQDFQQEDMTGPERLLEVGRRLNADTIVPGRVGSWKGAYPVHTPMIGVETGVIVPSEDIVYQGELVGLLSENMDSVAARLAQAEGEGEVAPTVTPSTGGKSSWPLWTGSIALVVSVALQLSAVASHEEAATKANQASADGDRDSFDEADIQREEAESQQTLALVLGGAGAGLILYYLLSGDSSDSSSNRGIESIAPPIVIGSHKGTFFIWFNTKW